MKIDVSTGMHPGVFTEVDDDVAHIVMRYRWAATKRGKALYVRGSVLGKDTLLHRFIMRPPADLCVDHINGDTLNNTKANLRICSQGENSKFTGERGGVPNKGHVHRVRRVLADGTVKIYHYNRKTKEPIGNEVVK